MTGRRLLTRRGAVLLGALLLACMGALWLLSQRPTGRTAVVECGGEIVEQVNLSMLAAPVQETFQGENGIQLTVEFSTDGARVLDSQCSDQVCVRTGQLTRAGEAAVCLPAQVVLRLAGSGDTIDGMTG